MRMRLLLMSLVLTAVVAGPAAAWTFELADSVAVSAGNVCVRDLAQGPVPAEAGAVVVVPGVRPGYRARVSRQTVLRRLVQARLADRVTLGGATHCEISVAGRTVRNDTLTDRIRELLDGHLPPAAAGAPPTWLETEVPAIDLVTAGSWNVSWPEPRTLTPGRNLLTLAVTTDHGTRRVSVTATAHIYGRTPQAVGRLHRDQTVESAQVGWVWTDLAAAPHDVITDPRMLTGMVLARDIDPGEAITAGALAAQPVVARGEKIELVVQRGVTRAVVAAECRQDGQLGQMVSVLNLLTRRLVVARVTAPGVVTMGR